MIKLVKIFFQQIANQIYRYPLAKIKYINKFGGLINYLAIMSNRNSMKRHSHKISKIISHKDGLPIYVLTGSEHIYQTLFCIQSLTKVSSEKFRFILIDDGSFNSTWTEDIEKQIVGVEIISVELINQNLDQKLPIANFPLLNKKRKEYPHIKKLTDIHTLEGTWKVVLDSDMLFWKEPTQLIEWLKSPSINIHIKDCVESYGYTANLMEKLCGNTIPELVNVGIIGLNSKNMKWEDIEMWCEELEKNEGTSYYLEQAITAMLLAGEAAIILPAQEYIVNPSAEQVIQREGVLHHYVDLSKAHYFNLAWKKVYNGIINR